MVLDADVQNITLIELYEFEYEDGTFERFTSFSKPVTFQSNTYINAPISRDSNEMESSMKVGTMRVSFLLSDYTKTLIDLNKIRNRRALDRGKFRLYQAELGDEDANYRLKFAGTTGKVEVSRLSLEIEFRDIFFLMKKNVPPYIYGEQCNVIFGDPIECTIDWDTIKVTGAAQAGSDDRTLIDSGRSEADGYFTRGKIRIDTGTLAGEESTIQEYTVGEFKLMPPLSGDLSIGDQYTAWPHCQKSYGGCEGLVNTDNFLGFRHVPRPEQM